MSFDSFVLRKITTATITEEQFDEIVELEQDSGLEPYTPELLKVDLDELDTWAFLDGDHVAGFITVTDEEWYFEGDLYILNINIGKAWRHSGLGTKLIHKAVSMHPDCKNITLDVEVDNTAAMNLYHKLGFRKIDLASNNGDTDIVMRNTREHCLRNCENTHIN